MVPIVSTGKPKDQRQNSYKIWKNISYFEAILTKNKLNVERQY
jgi:hypothetical protein